MNFGGNQIRKCSEGRGAREEKCQNSGSGSRWNTSPADHEQVKNAAMAVSI